MPLNHVCTSSHDDTMCERHDDTICLHGSQDECFNGPKRCIHSSLIAMDMARYLRCTGPMLWRNKICLNLAHHEPKTVYSIGIGSISTIIVVVAAVAAAAAAAAAAAD